MFPVPDFTAAIAQLVRAQDCDSWGRGFESRWPPHFSWRVIAFSPSYIAQACGAIPWPQGLGTKAKISANLPKIARLIQPLAVNLVALQEIDENSRWNGSFDHLVSLIPGENDQRNFLSTPAT